MFYVPMIKSDISSTLDENAIFRFPALYPITTKPPKKIRTKLSRSRVTHCTRMKLCLWITSFKPVIKIRFWFVLILARLNLIHVRPKCSNWLIFAIYFSWELVKFTPFNEIPIILGYIILNCHLKLTFFIFVRLIIIAIQLL